MIIFGKCKKCHAEVYGNVKPDSLEAKNPICDKCVVKVKATHSGKAVKIPLSTPWRRVK